MAVKEIPDIPDNLIAAGIVENLVPPAGVQFHAHIRDAPAQEMVVAEDIDYDRMPHKRTPYNLPRQEVDR